MVLQVTTQTKPFSSLSYWRNGKINQALAATLTWEARYLFPALALIPGTNEGCVLVQSHLANSHSATSHGGRKPHPGTIPIDLSL